VSDFHLDVPGVEVPPAVLDATQPMTGPTGPEGFLVACVGVPVDGASPVDVASLGYCVWLAATVTEDLVVETDEPVVEDGEPLTE
jgi:hypothetical protein